VANPASVLRGFNYRCSIAGRTIMESKESLVGGSVKGSLAHVYKLIGKN
jgi:hypothetical protein